MKKWLLPVQGIPVMWRGCRIYVDSFDPSGKCLFYRWDYAETWEYRIPFIVTNKTC
jgi:hypothetical protein